MSSLSGGRPYSRLSRGCKWCAGVTGGALSARVYWCRFRGMSVHPAWPPASAPKGHTGLQQVLCRFLPALGCPTRHQSPIFRPCELNRRMPAVRAQPIAGGKGSLTPFPRFSLSTRDLVASLLRRWLLLSLSCEAPTVLDASAGNIGGYFLV